MKIFKIIISTIIILIISVLIAAFFAPTTKVVERSVTIDASKGIVFGQISDFKTWPHWDAWYAKDTTQVRTYIGQLGDEKYGYQWESEEDNVGNGSIYFTSISGQDTLLYDFSFDENDDDDGIEQQAMGYFYLSENEESTSVTWGMISTMNYPAQILNYFLDAMVGPDLEEGLNNLKTRLESEAFAKALLDIVQVEDVHGTSYAFIKKDNYNIAEMTAFFEESYPIVYDYLRENDLTPMGPSCAFYYSWDEQNNETTLAAAVPISAESTVYETPIDLGVGQSYMSETAVVCDYEGAYTQSIDVHTAINVWLADNNKMIETPVIEEYIRGPYDTPDSTDYLTRVIYHFSSN